MQHHLTGCAEQKALLRSIDLKTAAKEAKMLLAQFCPVVYMTGSLRPRPSGCVVAYYSAYLNAGTTGLSRKSHLASFLPL